MNTDQNGLNLLASSHSEHGLNKNTTVLPIIHDATFDENEGFATGNNTMEPR